MTTGTILFNRHSNVTINKKHGIFFVYIRGMKFFGYCYMKITFGWQQLIYLYIRIAISFFTYCLLCFQAVLPGLLIKDILRSSCWMFVGCKWKTHNTQQMNWLDFEIDPNEDKGTVKSNVGDTFSSVIFFPVCKYTSGIFEAFSVTELVLGSSCFYWIAPCDL